MPSNESVIPTVSVSAITKLNEPNLLTPTPLPELKKDKLFFKNLVKRDKDLEVLKKKHEKCRENMQEIHEVHVERLIGQQVKDKAVLEKSHSKNLKRASKEGMDVNIVQRQNHEEFTKFTQEQEQKLKELRKSNAEVFVEMCKSHFQAELDVYVRHNTPIYETLRLVMDQNHKEHINKLKLIHDQEVKDLTKRMDAESKEQMRQLQKKHKDKQAINRLKRENQKRHIDTMVAERSKLKDILDQRLEELEKKLEGVKEDLEKDKKLAVKEHEEHFHKRCSRLEDEFRDLLTLDVRPVPQQSNGTEMHYKTQL